MSEKKKQAKTAGTLQLLGKPKRSEPPVEDTFKPSTAAEELDEIIVDKAIEWYRLGATRGAIEALQAILDGTITVKANKQGKVALVARKKTIKWKQALTVNTVSERIRTEPFQHTLPVGSLGFK